MAVGVIDTKIKFKLGDRELTLDYRRVPFSAWSQLKQATKFTQRTLVEALDAFDLDAIVGLIWLERTQRQRRLNYIDVFQELQNADHDEEFEVIDLIIKGRSVFGRDTRETDGDGEVDPDPTNGS